ncbi:MAG: FHA domain-containing protein [Deltaproteobacteria bacterium]|nr:MAG: FHA domain-containing protein [Deltaproteobacteria bacterium]TMQ13912.1 MAG: FHA domain-containing protein [Deltaproteobacteria bacterium]
MSNRDSTRLDDGIDDRTQRLPRVARWGISTAMDAAAHYRHLLALGRDEFLATAAPAVLVRYRGLARGPNHPGPATLTMTLDEELGDAVDEASARGKFTPESAEMELYALAKKPGASFRDRITIGRTLNNDVVIADPSVSRLHAYVRQADGWVVADAGSKNGSWLGNAALEPRRETPLPAGALLRFGDVRFTFFRSEDLFDLLGGDHGRR